MEFSERFIQDVSLFISLRFAVHVQFSADSAEVSVSLSWMPASFSETLLLHHIKSQPETRLKPGELPQGRTDTKCNAATSFFFFFFEITCCNSSFIVPPMPPHPLVSCLSPLCFPIFPQLGLKADLFHVMQSVCNHSVAPWAC